MPLFGISKINREVQVASAKSDGGSGVEIAASVKEWKMAQKKTRQSDAERYASKKLERSSRIVALLEVSNSHRQGGASTICYNPESAPTKSLKQASNVGLSTVSIATKRLLFGSSK
jgi:hypothetical protein